MAENKISVVNSNADCSHLIYIMNSLKYVFIAEHLSGIFRISFKSGQLALPNWKKKVFAVSVIILYVGTYAAFLDLPFFIGGSAYLYEVIDEIPFVITLIQYITTLITTSLMYNKTNKEIFRLFSDLDDQLIKMTDEFYRKSRAKANTFLFFAVVSHVIISLTDLSTDDAIDISEVIFLPLYLIQKIELVMFCLKIEMLKGRLDVINGYIAKFLDERDSDNQSVFTLSEENRVPKVKLNIIGRPSENNMKIRDLATMYDSIGCICSLVNSVFNFQIFMTLVSTFTYIVITIWTSLYYYRSPENHTGKLITIVIWCLTTLLTVAVTCFVCERLRMARKSTKILVNEIIMDYGLPKTMRVQAKAFMELIEAWPLKVLIYDMFSVDITLMLKFISVSTTYLIVIIQISHFN